MADDQHRSPPPRPYPDRRPGVMFNVAVRCTTYVLPLPRFQWRDSSPHSLLSTKPYLIILILLYIFPSRILKSGRLSPHSPTPERPVESSTACARSCLVSVRHARLEQNAPSTPPTRLSIGESRSIETRQILGEKGQKKDKESKRGPVSSLSCSIRFKYAHP